MNHTARALGATANPDASKTIVFSPTQAGTYTFYAMATTNYYPSWTAYASTTVTVTAPPTVTLTANGQYPTLTIPQGTRWTAAWNSSNATSCSGSYVSTNGQGSGTLPLTADQPGSKLLGIIGTLTVSCTGTGGTTSKTVTVNQSCTPAYTCSGNTIQYTDSSCNVTNVTSCVSPAFCSTGSSICLYPAITVGTGGSLALSPDIVKSGASTKVSWNVSNAQSCTVTGTNGDSWTGLSSPSGGETSSPIKGQTTYTLSCIGYSPNPNLSQSETVGITPLFQEN